MYNHHHQELIYLVQHGEQDGNHHGAGGRVRDPHGQEGRGQHEAEQQQPWRSSDNLQHVEGNPVVKVGVFYGDGHQETFS